MRDIDPNEHQTSTPNVLNKYYILDKQNRSTEGCSSSQH